MHTTTASSVCCDTSHVGSLDTLHAADGLVDAMPGNYILYILLEMLRYDDTAMHTCLLVVLGILGQCAPVYPYVDLSG